MSTIPVLMVRIMDRAVMRRIGICRIDARSCSSGPDPLVPNPSRIAAPTRSTQDNDAANPTRSHQLMGPPLTLQGATVSQLRAWCLQRSLPLSLDRTVLVQRLQADARRTDTLPNPPVWSNIVPRAPLKARAVVPPTVTPLSPQPATSESRPIDSRTWPPPEARGRTCLACGLHLRHFAHMVHHVLKKPKCRHALPVDLVQYYRQYQQRKGRRRRRHGRKAKPIE